MSRGVYCLSPKRWQIFKESNPFLYRKMLYTQRLLSGTHIPLKVVTASTNNGKHCHRREIVKLGFEFREKYIALLFKKIMLWLLKKTKIRTITIDMSMQKIKLPPGWKIKFREETSRKLIFPYYYYPAETEAFVVERGNILRGVILKNGVMFLCPRFTILTKEHICGEKQSYSYEMSLLDFETRNETYINSRTTSQEDRSLERKLYNDAKKILLKKLPRLYEVSAYWGQEIIFDWK